MVAYQIVIRLRKAQYGWQDEASPSELYDIQPSMTKIESDRVQYET